MESELLLSRTAVRATVLQESIELYPIQGLWSTLFRAFIRRTFFTESFAFHNPPISDGGKLLTIHRKWATIKAVKLHAIS